MGRAELRLGLAPPEEGVGHVQVAEGGRHDAEQEEEDDGDKRDGQPGLLAAPLLLHVVADVQAAAEAAGPVNGVDQVEVEHGQDGHGDQLEVDEHGGGA